jgi:tRNA G46 methylase TrmB
MLCNDLLSKNMNITITKRMQSNKSYYVNAKHDLYNLRKRSNDTETNDTKTNDTSDIKKIRDEYLKTVIDCYKDYKTTGSISTMQRVHESVKNVSSYSTVYGELTFQGIEILGKIINGQKIKIFMDIGSGNGKIPITLAIEPSIRTSFGVELVEERYNNAMTVRKRLGENQRFGQFLKKIDLVNDDMFNIDYQKITNESRTLVFISNLCFGEEITSQLFMKLGKELPIGSIVASSKIPSRIPGCFRAIDSKDSNGSNDSWDIPGFSVSGGTTKMPMTWINNSTVYFHELVTKCQ